ncbi:hypothetical protein DFH08DRAFT_1026663 [Mycena albidolilacea]|uniref:Uncharacterized protein n=1 Tax=Mycena albidolilacea TaxID=1033008 RepID=A0AAD7EJH5_9AGAR|nr:hypothetical protein DFH08DRAFT_1026663 [Mycena albidolilacea]
MVKTLHLFVAALAAAARSVGVHPAKSNRDSRRFDDLGALISAPASPDSAPAVGMGQNSAAETRKLEQAVAAASGMESSVSTASSAPPQTEPFPVLSALGLTGQLLRPKARGSDVRFDDSTATFDNDDDDDTDETDGNGGLFFSFFYDFFFFMMVFWFIYWLAFYDSEDSEMEAHASVAKARKSTIVAFTAIEIEMAQKQTKKAAYKATRRANAPKHRKRNDGEEVLVKFPSKLYALLINLMPGVKITSPPKNHEGRHDHGKNRRTGHTGTDEKHIDSRKLQLLKNFRSWTPYGNHRASAPNKKKIGAKNPAIPTEMVRSTFQWTGRVNIKAIIP